MAWGGYWGLDEYVLRCGKDASHTTIHKRLTTRKLFKPDGTTVEVDIMTQREVGDTTALAIPTTEAGMLKRTDEAEKLGLFPQRMNAQQRQHPALVALAYGLDPLMGEIIPYQGKPYITIEGRRRKDAEAGHHPSIKFRTLTQPEKEWYKEAGGLNEGDLAIICLLRTQFPNGDVSEVEALGRVLKSETTGDPHLPIVKWRIEMTQKRAEYRARRMAYGPIPLPARLDVSLMSELQVGENDDVAIPPREVPSPAGYYCGDHNTPFQRHEREGRVWYSHRQGSGWCNMKDPPQGAEPGPGPAGDTFDPDKEPPPPLPDTVHSRGHMEQVLKDENWSIARLEIDVLKMPLDRYIRDGHKLQDAYIAWRQHVGTGA